jgi:hypothetical protein
MAPPRHGCCPRSQGRERYDRLPGIERQGNAMAPTQQRAVELGVGCGEREDSGGRTTRFYCMRLKRTLLTSRARVSLKVLRAGVPMRLAARVHR